MKKLTLFLLVLACFLAACGPAGETPATDGTPSAADPTQSASIVSSTALPEPSQDPSRGAYVDGFWRWNEPVVFTAYAPYFPEFCQTPSKLWHYEWIKDKMNIEFQIEGVEASTMEERTTLMLASGDLPDLLFRWGLGSVAQNKRYGDEENLIVPMNGYLTEEYMPHIKEYLDSHPNYWTENATPAGNLYMFPEIYDAEYNTTAWHWATWYKPEMYTAVGYDQQPQTVDELIDALTKIRDQDPAGKGNDNVPMGGAWDNNNIDTFMLRAYGFIANWHTQLAVLKGGDAYTGELVFMPSDPAYYEYLKTMNLMYREKLIEQDYFTLDLNQVTAHCASGYYSAFSAYSVAAYLENGGTDQFAEWEIMEPITSPLNDQKIVAGGFADAGTGSLFVSSACDERQLEAIYRYMDYGYQNEDNVSDRFYAGPEKDVDEKYGFDLIGWTRDENGNLIENDLVTVNPDGKYPDTNTLRQGQISVWGNGGGRLDRRTDGNYLKDLDITAVGGYSTDQYYKHYSPFYVPYFRGVLVEDQYIDSQADLDTVLTDYMESERAKFITGARELSEAEWEKYVADLNQMGAETYFSVIRSAFRATYGR